MRTITEDAWRAEFLPTTEEPIALNALPVGTRPHFVWTVVEGDDGLVIVPGYAMVNRLSYYVTEHPHNSNVIVSLED